MPATCLQIGRWLGYSTALLLALYSLFNIVKTFKRVLFLRIFLNKPHQEQVAIVDGLRNNHSVDARLLARAMDNADEDAQHEIIPFKLPAHGGLRQRGSGVAPPLVDGLRAAVAGGPGLDGTASSADPSVALQPCGSFPASPFETDAVKSLKRTATLARIDSLKPKKSAAGQPTNAARFSGEDSAMVAIAQDIQRLEVC